MRSGLCHGRLAKAWTGLTRPRSIINGTACCAQGASAGIRAQADAYRDVRDNLSEGLRFYMSLQEAIVTLQQQIGDFCLTRRIQR